MINIAIICIAIVVIVIVIILSILLYHMMLALNEHNKRLIVFAQEAIEKERATMQELNAATLELERLSNELSSNQASENENPIYQDEDLE